MEDYEILPYPEDMIPLTAMIRSTITRILIRSRSMPTAAAVLPPV